jgi:SAM-dependent methyltransferase
LNAEVHDDPAVIGSYEMLRLKTAENFFKPAIIRSGVIERGAVALEIGCGRGFKAAILGDLFSQYVGVDLNAEHVDLGNGYLQQIGGRAQLHVANGLEVLASPARFGLEKAPDFLILFAVLEHLLPDERQEMLRLARQVVDDGGSVLIAETPNRLIPLDTHSSNMHFAQMLPPELMLRYVQETTSAAWMHDLRAMGNDVTALHRAGISLSYHDFDLDFGTDPSFVFSGWSGDLLAHQPLRTDERHLLQYFDDNRVKAHPAFARYWIEGLINNRVRRRHVSTQNARLTEAKGRVYPGRAAWDYQAVTIYGDYHARYDCGNIVGDDFEVIVQVDLGSADGTVTVEVGGVRHQFDPRCQEGILEGCWHGIATFRLTAEACPEQLVISSDGHAVIRAVVINGYSS